MNALRFRWVIVLESASGKRDARISDISMGGCFVDSITQMSEGETAVFQVHLPMGLWVQLYGEVVYLSPGFGFGLRFTRLAEEERILLEQVITAHGGKPSPPLAATVAMDIEPPARAGSRSANFAETATSAHCR